MTRRDKAWLLAALFAAPAFGAEPPFAEIDALQQRAIEGAQQILEEVGALDDATQALVHDYRRAIAEIDRLERATADARRQLDGLEQRIATTETSLAEVDDLETRLLPLAREMIDTLARFVALDLPFLTEERGARVAQLKQLADDPERDPGLLFRRVLEAYQVEMGYGYPFGSETLTLELDGRKVPVQLLHAGRTTALYRTLDGSAAGVWDRSAGRWRPLPAAATVDLDRAFRAARGQPLDAPVRLPVVVTAEPPR